MLTGDVASGAVVCRDSGFGYDSCIINNGLAPPSVENVIDDGRYTADQRVYVRNVACPPNWGGAYVLADDPCPAPGAPTEVEVADGGLVSWIRVRDSSSFAFTGGTVTWTVRTYDSSDSTLSGGWVPYVWAYDSSSVTLEDGFRTSEVSTYDSSTVTMSGGTVEGDLWPQDFSTMTVSAGTVTGYLKPSGSSTVTMGGGWVSQLLAAGSSSVTISGGTVWSQLTALDSSTVTIDGGALAGVGAVNSSIITIEGSDFEVNGAPVPYGDLAAETGTLTGTLASGDPIDYYFYQGGGEGAYYTGTITLVEAPEPSTVLLQGSALLILMGLAARRRH